MTASAMRLAMKIMGTQFVLDTDIGSALEKAREREGRGYRYCYDRLGEGARTRLDADRAYESYVSALSALKVSGGDDWTLRDGQ